MTGAVGLLLLTACTSGDGVPKAGGGAVTTTAAAAEVVLRGSVAVVFASARVMQLSPPVNGVANVALTTDTEIVRAGGARATLGDITPGSMIEAVGRPSTAETLVARRITLL